MTLVCGQKLLTAACRIVPPWWGVLLAKAESGGVTLTSIRPPEQNVSQDKAALARMLWKCEALKSLQRSGHRTVTLKSSAEEVWNEAAERLDVTTLANEVRLAIKARGGSGFAKQLIPNGGSRTIESIVLANRYSRNLEWLLSQLPDGPPR
jgi:hypothetical protein